MRQHRQSVGACDQVNCIFYAELIALYISGATRAEIFLESFRHVLHITSLKQRLGDVRPTHSTVSYLPHALPGNMNTLLIQTLDHALPTTFASIPQHLQHSLKRR